MATLINGDCLDKLRQLDDNSVDSIVTDPPYGLSFMGKKWDYDVPTKEIWMECLRVLKPGGFLLSFGGSRTYHRMTVEIEDAGFEIRDQIMWVYGSGFPKSHNVGKSVDKLLGNEREVTGTKLTNVGMQGNNFKSKSETGEVTVTKGSSDWEGWGTALKPAHEPIVMARKPFKGTVAKNVLEYGTGAINIDDCRVGNESRTYDLTMTSGNFETTNGGKNKKSGEVTVEGRYPANFIHDGSDEVVSQFPNAKGGAYPAKRGEAINTSFAGGQEGIPRQMGDDGSAARFFYCAKASKKDRNAGCEGMAEKDVVTFATANGTSGKASSLSEGRNTKYQNNHPTVKPQALMAYLCRLVTQPNGVVLDPFMGSGSTGRAALSEGFDFIGIEREPEYFQIAQARVTNE